MRSSPWRIDAALATDAAALLGWDPATGPEALVGPLGRRVPAGSTAKLAAMAAGEVPPGRDPDALLRRVLADADADRPSPSYSCWVLCTVYAALVETLDVGRTSIVVTRRIDERSPIVDLHSSVLVDPDAPTDADTDRRGDTDRDGDRGARLVDPYFYVALGGPGGDDVEAVGAGVWALRTDEADGRWSYRVHHARWATPLRYRILGVDLDRDDVHAFCAVSAQFSGVTPRNSANLLTVDGMVDARQNEDGTATVRHVVADHPGQAWSAAVHRTVEPDWPTAMARLADLTGVRVT